MEFRSDVGDGGFREATLAFPPGPAPVGVRRRVRAVSLHPFIQCLLGNGEDLDHGTLEALVGLRALDYFCWLGRNIPIVAHEQVLVFAGQNSDNESWIELLRER